MLQQKINTYIGIVVILAVGLGASALIIRVANVSTFDGSNAASNLFATPGEGS